MIPQTEIGQRKSVVMDGRDIGTKVLPDAECKFYLDASPAVRAKRRADEMAAKGVFVDPAALEKEISERDYRDMHRENSPLCAAEDAVVIDSSYMTIEEVVEKMLSVIEERLKTIDCN